MLVMSGLYPLLEIHSHDPHGQPLAIYGDPAYPHRVHLQCPYKGANLSNAQQQFIASMSSVRVAVEWPFGEIATYSAFNDFKKNLKIGLSPVGKMYTVAAILRNAVTCLYGSSTNSFFNLNPPTLQEYFQPNGN